MNSIVTNPQAKDFALNTLQILNPTLFQHSPTEQAKPKPKPQQLEQPGPNRVIGTTDYQKWEHLEEEEDSAELKKKKEEEYVKSMCSQNHRKEIQLYEKPTSEKLTAAETFRQQGNDAFRNTKNASLAALLYRKGMLQLDYTFPDTPEEQDQFNRLEILLHLNMSLCKFHMEELDECLSHCHRVLSLEKNHPKALFRRAQVHLKRDLFDKAQEDLNTILKTDPHCKEARDLLKELKSKVSNYKQKTQTICKSMITSE